MKKLTFGIDKMAFYTSHYYLDLQDLAAKRQVPVKKYQQSIGQHQISIADPSTDIVTLAANAAQRIVQESDIPDIDLVLLATESSIDESKAAGIYVHDLLHLSPYCRVVELKEACYSATAAIQLALNMIRLNPTKKALVLAADVAHYDLNSAGEPTQGCGAVAMLLSANPKLLAIEEGSGYYTQHAMDFWRPTYRKTARVDGRFSALTYLDALRHTWQHYTQQTQRRYQQHDHFGLHTPFPAMVEKGYGFLAKLNDIQLSHDNVQQQTATFLRYARRCGNCYTASLYLGLISLLDNSTHDLTNQRIGVFSFGAGYVAEFYSMRVQPGYKKYLTPDVNRKLLDQRQRLTVDEYEYFHEFAFPTNGHDLVLPTYAGGTFRLAAIEDEQRIYQCKQ
ncbi:MAG: hydroxymethylglutaryl-CoA synthase [Gammaproteobacteria bacterium]